MAKGVNKVILLGNVGNDPETRYMPSGAAVTNASIATSESWMDKQTGQKQERTEWHKVTFMDRGNYQLGKIAGDFLRKGSKVYVEGSLRTREWEKDGVKRYTTEIIASDMQLLDARDPNANTGTQGGHAQQGQQAPQAQPQSYGSWNTPAQANGAQAQNWQQPAPQQNSYAQQSGGTQYRQSPQPQPAPNFDDFDDDIPF